MRENNMRKETIEVITYSGVEAERVNEVKEAWLKEGQATFNGCKLDYENVFYLIGNSTEFIVATELNIPITIVEYDKNDFVHISKFGYTAAQFTELVDEDGNVRVGDFFDNYLWSGDTYEVEADLTIGEPVYTLTPKEQEMKMQTPFESGAEIHKAYIELIMSEDSGLKNYIKYYIEKTKAQQN